MVTILWRRMSFIYIVKLFTNRTVQWHVFRYVVDLMRKVRRGWYSGLSISISYAKYLAPRASLWYALRPKRHAGLVVWTPLSLFGRAASWAIQLQYLCLSSATLDSTHDALCAKNIIVSLFSISFSLWKGTSMHFHKERHPWRDIPYASLSNSFNSSSTSASKESSLM